MKLLLCASLLAAAFVGCRPSGTVLGKLRKDPLVSVLAVNAGTAPPDITLQGVMVEKCPQAGCWFRLDDGTGVIKVDTKAAGFVVTAVPLNAKVTVSGKIGSDGSEALVEASGVRY